MCLAGYRYLELVLVATDWSDTENGGKRGGNQRKAYVKKRGRRDRETHRKGKQERKKTKLKNELS